MRRPVVEERPPAQKDLAASVLTADPARGLLNPKLTRQRLLEEHGLVSLERVLDVGYSGDGSWEFKVEW